MQGREGPLLYSPWASASPEHHQDPRTCKIGSSPAQLLPVRHRNRPGIISDTVSLGVSGLSGSPSMTGSVSRALREMAVGRRKRIVPSRTDHHLVVEDTHQVPATGGLRAHAPR